MPRNVITKENQQSMKIPGASKKVNQQTRKKENENPKDKLETNI